MTDVLQQQDFAPHVGKRFRFPGHAVPLQLVSLEVRHDAAERGQGGGPPFSLIFRGPPGSILPEGLYQAEIEDGPVLEFYIMPIHTAGRERQDYQALFN
jgi:hypothetical protein